MSKRKKPSDAPLTVTVSGGKLSITIGTRTLVHAALCSNEAWDMLGEGNADRDPRDHIKIRNSVGFARDVARALTDELGEDGRSRLTNVLDAAWAAAVEDGSEHVDFPDDCQ